MFKFKEADNPPLTTSYSNELDAKVSKRVRDYVQQFPKDIQENQYSKIMLKLHISKTAAQTGFGDAERIFHDISQMGPISRTQYTGFWNDVVDGRKQASKGLYLNYLYGQRMVGKNYLEKKSAQYTGIKGSEVDIDKEIEAMEKIVNSYNPKENRPAIAYVGRFTSEVVGSMVGLIRNQANPYKSKALSYDPWTGEKFDPNAMFTAKSDNFIENIVDATVGTFAGAQFEGLLKIGVDKQIAQNIALFGGSTEALLEILSLGILGGVVGKTIGTGVKIAAKKVVKKSAASSLKRVLASKIMKASSGKISKKAAESAAVKGLVNFGKKIPGRAKAVLIGSIEEGFTEATQELVSITGQLLGEKFTDPSQIEAGWGPDWMAIPKAFAQAAIGTAVLGIGTSSFGVVSEWGYRKATGAKNLGTLEQFNPIMEKMEKSGVKYTGKGMVVESVDLDVSNVTAGYKKEGETHSYASINRHKDVRSVFEYTIKDGTLSIESVLKASKNEDLSANIIGFFNHVLTQHKDVRNITGTEHYIGKNIDKVWSNKVKEIRLRVAEESMKPIQNSIERLTAEREELIKDIDSLPETETEIEIKKTNEARLEVVEQELSQQYTQLSEVQNNLADAAIDYSEPESENESIHAIYREGPAAVSGIYKFKAYTGVINQISRSKVGKGARAVFKGIDNESNAKRAFIAKIDTISTTMNQLGFNAAIPSFRAALRDMSNTLSKTSENIEGASLVDAPFSEMEKEVLFALYTQNYISEAGFSYIANEVKYKPFKDIAVEIKSRSAEKYRRSFRDGNYFPKAIAKKHLTEGMYEQYLEVWSEMTDSFSGSEYFSIMSAAENATSFQIFKDRLSRKKWNFSFSRNLGGESWLSQGWISKAMYSYARYISSYSKSSLESSAIPEMAPLNKQKATIENTIADIDYESMTLGNILEITNKDSSLKISKNDQSGAKEGYLKKNIESSIEKIKRAIAGGLRVETSLEAKTAYSSTEIFFKQLLDDNANPYINKNDSYLQSTKIDFMKAMKAITAFLGKYEIQNPLDNETASSISKIKNLDDLTVTEVNALGRLKESVESIGRSEKGLKDSIEQQEAARILITIRNNMAKNESNNRSVKASKKQLNRFAKSAKVGTFAHLIAPHFLTEILDGGEAGPISKLFIQDAEIMRNDAAKAANKRIKAVEAKMKSASLLRKTGHLSGAVSKVNLDFSSTKASPLEYVSYMQHAGWLKDAGRAYEIAKELETKNVEKTGIGPELVVEVIFEANAMEIKKKDGKPFIEAAFSTDKELILDDIRESMKSRKYQIGELMYIYSMQFERTQMNAITNFFSHSCPGSFNAVIDYVNNSKEFKSYREITTDIMSDLNNNFDKFQQSIEEVLGKGVDRVVNYSMIQREVDIADYTRYQDILQKVTEEVHRTPAQAKGRTVVDEGPDIKMLNLVNSWLGIVSLQEHFTASIPWFKRTETVLKDAEFKDQLNRIYKDSAYNVLTRYREQVVNPSADFPKNKVDKFTRKWIPRMYAGILGMKPYLALRQAVSINLFLAYTSEVHLIKGTAQFLANPKKTLEFIKERSNQFADTSIEYLPANVAMFGLEAEKLTKRSVNEKWLSDIGMWGVKAVDVGTKASGWISVYNKAITEMAETEAIALADESILKTQPVGALSTKSTIQRSSMLKLLTLFQGQQQQLFNMQLKSAYGIMNGKKFQMGYGRRKSMLYKALMGIFLSKALFLVWSKAEIPDSEEDAKQWIKEALISDVPLVGRMFTSNMAGDPLVGGTVDNIKVVGNSIDDFFNSGEGDDLIRALKGGARITGLTTGIGHSIITQPISAYESFKSSGEYTDFLHFAIFGKKFKTGDDE